MKKKIFLIFVIFGTGCLLVGGYFFQQYQQFIKNPVFSKTTIVEIAKGQHFQNFTKNIKKLNANGENWQWMLFAKIEKTGGWLTVGEFEIDNTLTPLQMMQKIKANNVITYKFTIVEGINWWELKEKLLDDSVLIHTLFDFTDEQLLQKLSIDAPSPEGMFLPETYQFVKGDSDIDILQRAHSALTKVLEENWQNRKPDIPIKDSYQLLTLASIVEKESAHANERDKIAGVFVRRLQKNMRLQTDPTVIYGIGPNFDGDIKNKDLKTDTPYNTYTRHGLPPTPIAMPSAESIHFSSHPADGKELYFVANNRGGHYFSDTYEEHLRAVEKYLKGQKL